jgi:hypothetical protein
MDRFRALLAASDWNSVLESQCVDTSYAAFWSNYSKLYEICFPMRKIRFNRNIHKKNQFMTEGLLNSRRTKQQLYEKFLADPTEPARALYKNFSKIYFKTVRAAKKLHYSNILTANAKNSKKTWDTFNEILGRGRPNESVEKIIINGQDVTDPVQIATGFNTFFTSIGKDISNSIPPTEKRPEDYINYGREIPLLNLGNTTPEHVKKVISKLANKNSCDVSGVSTRMIKTVGNEIAVPLSHIFNLSLSNGVFPSQLKNCRVIPIFKAGDHTERDNYRPISLLSSFSKILEKIVAEKLIEHLLSNDLLYLHQYGFLPNRSSEQNLIQIVNYISEALNDNMYCIGIFLDLKKAFDVCSHEILLRKLQKMGIQGTAYNWFASYLSNRAQCVDINGKLSDFLALDISVIQGSTLGPILFLCYINDFWSASTLFSLLFADDTTGLAKGKVLSELSEYVNTELQKIALWYRANKMAVNTSKTKFIVFRTHGKQINPDHCRIVFNSNEIGQPVNPDMIKPIERIHNEGNEKSFKLLGVYLDEYLSFNDHVSKLCAKISKSLFCLNRIKNFVNVKALKTLYLAMVQSNISYCINVYGCANNSTLKPLVLKQKQAIRIISHAGYYDHTGPLFVQHQILPLNELILYSRMKFMHNYMFGNVPPSFFDMWLTNRERNNIRILRNADDLFVPPHRIELYKRMPLIAFASAWNEADDKKYNQCQKIFLKEFKADLLAGL